MDTKPSSAFLLIQALSGLSDEELKVIAEKPHLLKGFANRLVTDILSATYIFPLNDWEVLPKRYHAAIAMWRYYASAINYTGPVVWQVREGFTLKKHAPLAGPCYSDLKYLLNWDIVNDKPTKSGLVFWIPRLVQGSTCKTIEQMKELRAEIWQHYDLPFHHADTTFGSITLLFGLILAEYKCTGERVPHQRLYAVSDTFKSDGSRLIAGGFGDQGLYCFYGDGYANEITGFFLLGMEEHE